MYRCNLVMYIYIHMHLFMYFGTAVVATTALYQLSPAFPKDPGLGWTAPPSGSWAGRSFQGLRQTPQKVGTLGWDC